MNDNFDWNNDRLDVFYFNRITSRQEFQQLWKVLKLVFILWHGNARVESGFSVNRDMLVENLKEVSLVAQRQVYDAIKAKGGILNVNITSEMRKRKLGLRKCRQKKGRERLSKLRS